MVYALLGFIFGLLIPYIARRFEKFMPATAAYAVYRILKPNKSVKRAKRKQNHKYVKLMKAYKIYSVGWGIVCGMLSYLAYISFFSPIPAVFFIWTMLLLFEIDKRMLLLPDILTIPLLIFGFCFSLFPVWVSPVDSAIGSFVGYFLPVIASLLIVWRHKDAFGGGDIKLLAAVGAWIGPEKLLYVIMLSCIIFALYALINRKRDGAFGPSIVMASIIIAFAFFSM